MKRFEIIDGMRGYFLVFMVLNHLIFAGGFFLVKFNHNQLAFVEDAQGFVFLSGLMIGMVYARKMMKAGYAAGRTAIYTRAFELYRYAMGIILMIMVAELLLPGAYTVWYNWMGYTNFDDPLRLASIATFLFQPTFMDILPQYIIYMLFAPMLIKLVLEDKWHYVVAISIILWMAGQLGLQQIVTAPVNDLIKGADDQGIRVSFNLLGWQIVFFSGLVFGALTSSGKVNWSSILSPDNTFIPKVALVVFLFFMPLRLITANEMMPAYMIAKFASMEIRGDFGPVYLLNFSAVAALIAWLLIAGPQHKAAWVRGISGAFQWLFSIRYLRLLGRHSLHVYVWHVAIIYFVYYFDGRTPELGNASKLAIAAVTVALLSLPAIWRERDKFFGSGGTPAPATVKAGPTANSPQQMVIR